MVAALSVTTCNYRPRGLRTMRCPQQCKWDENQTASRSTPNTTLENGETNVSVLVATTCNKSSQISVGFSGIIMREHEDTRILVSSAQLLDYTEHCRKLNHIASDIS